jgi:hypothetical protein
MARERIPVLAWAGVLVLLNSANRILRAGAYLNVTDRHEVGTEQAPETNAILKAANAK